MGAFAVESLGVDQPTLALDFVDVAAPSAGANAAYPVTGQYAMRVLAARCQVDTDANVANRIVSVDYLKTGGATYLRNLPAVAITASTVAQTVEWGPQYGQWDVNTNTPLVVPLLPLWLPPGFTVQVTLDNKQAGDTLTNVRLVVERALAQP